MNRLSTLILGTALLVGCSGKAAVNAPTVKLSTSPAVASGRTIDFQVRSLSSMADSSGKIVNADPAGIVSAGAGNLIAAGAGNIIAQGAGNLVAAGAGNFAAKFELLTTAQANFTVVGKAVLHVEDVNGVPISNVYVQATDDGKATLLGMPDGQPLVVVAQWKENGQVYRTSTVLGAGAPVMRVEFDPINQFVQGRVRTLLKQSGKLNAVSGARLAEVWGYFNDANIAMDPSILRDDAKIEDLDAFYKAKVGLLPADRQCKVKQYMASISASPPPDAATCANSAAPVTSPAASASPSIAPSAGTSASPSASVSPSPSH